MSVSPLRRALAAAVALAISSASIAATLFFEDFQTRIDADSGQPVRRCSGLGGAGTYPFPDGWLLRNVDSRTPSAQVAYVNDAWEVREDFQLDTTNCVAFSTSWYVPAGAANDWMWTPAISLPTTGASFVSWRARAYDAQFPDGYQVRVMVAPAVPTGGTGAIGNQLANSTVIFSTDGESPSWTHRTADLSTYAGQTIYIGFRNNADDKFLLVVDDIKVATASPDLSASAAPGFAVDYSRVPENLGVPANLKVVGSNAGNVPLTNLTATAQLELDGNPQDSPQSAPGVALLNPSDSTTFVFAPAPSLDRRGVWSVSYTLGSDQNGADVAPANNQLDAGLTTVTGTEWARHEGGVAGTLGIGSENGGEIGTSFVLPQTASFEGVRFGMGSVTDPADRPNSWPGKSIVANLRAADAVSGMPGALIATTTAITSSYAGGVYEVRFTGGPQTLAPGRYFVSVVEPFILDPMPLQMSLQRFTTAASWVYWQVIPGGTWQTLESFGPDFRRVPNISLLTELPIFKDGFESSAPPPQIDAPLRTRRQGEHAALAASRQ